MDLWVVQAPDGIDHGADQHDMGAGCWRGLQVAIKTIVFESAPLEHQTATIASEAAIASNLSHRNVVGTYSHDIRAIDAAMQTNELSLFKFYMIQACCRPFLPPSAHIRCALCLCLVHVWLGTPGTLWVLFLLRILAMLLNTLDGAM